MSLEQSISSTTTGLVDVYDPISNTILTSIEIGHDPFGVAISPDGSRVYVTNSQSNNVSVINTTNNTVIATVQVGASPSGICITPDGHWVYVSNRESNTLSVISASTNTVHATIPVQKDPLGISVSPEGNRIYVASSFKGVSVIDVATNQVITTISIGYPIGVSVSPDGKRVYATSVSESAVKVIDAATNTIMASIPVGDIPYGISVSPDGSRVYVSNELLNTVSVIDALASAVIATIPVGLRPNGISVSPDGKRVYVINSLGFSMSIIDAAANTVIEKIFFPKPVGNNLGNFVQSGLCKGEPVNFTITVLPMLSLQANSTLSVNQPISVTATGCSGGGTINWSPQGGLGSADGAVYTFSAPGSYTLSASCTLGSYTSQTSTPTTLTILPSVPIFAIASVNLISCEATDTGRRLIKFDPVYTGQTGEKIVLAIAYDNFITDQSGPYTLEVPIDQTILTFIAQQGGTTAIYNYRWLDACTQATSNQQPITTGIPSQTALVGQAYQLNLATYFVDPNKDPLRFIVSGLPDHLKLTGSIISGTLSSTESFVISVTAVNPKGLFVSTTFQLTVNEVIPPTQPFTIVSVIMNGCQNLGNNLRLVSFSNQYAGLTGEPIVLAMTNGYITTLAGPYSQTLSTDQPLLTLIANQGGATAVFNYNWLSACGSGARRAIGEISTDLQVKVLGNPVQGQQVELEIRGVVGSWVEVSLLDAQGRSNHQQRLTWLTDGERVSVPLAPALGMQLVKVQTESQSQTLKVIKGR
ncbi:MULTISPECIES: beta-propeller fold lactonase family protein [unclassified Spirosoma]|uniref:YVTN family beta-propeller repeat protein n=1 Tax=unclassified Spirosoma TaxID=2621999 RepID=UPI001AC61663|nr:MULTISPECIES: beta-propeller fold lactonase family protein [unclassified Spirosoma]MBN8821326.1 beta-propeller fold lactonase family protein [Spirosoma sp.]